VADGQNTVQITVQITVALLTIVGSGVASAIVNYKLNTQKAHQDLLRQKLEELFSTVQSLSAIQASALRVHLPVMKEQRTFDVANALTDRYLQDERYTATAQKCDLLIALYFPMVRPTWQTWEQKRKRIIDLYKECASKMEKGQNVGDLADPYEKAIIDFENFAENVKSELAALAPSLLRPEPLIAWRQAWHWISTNIRQLFKVKDET
jgi:protein-tyrosine-phosphatase